MSTRLASIAILFGACVGCERRTTVGTGPASPASPATSVALPGADGQIVFDGAKPRDSAAFRELDAYLAQQNLQGRREKYLKLEFDDAVAYAKNVRVDVELANKAELFAEMQSVADELRFLAELAFEGYLHGAPPRRGNPSVVTVSTWLSLLRNKGIHRPKDLLEQIRAGKLNDTDDFYHLGDGPAPATHDVKIPSLKAITARLGENHRWQVEGSEFARRHSMRGQQQEINLLDAKISAIAEEMPNLAPYLRPTYAGIQKTLTKTLALAQQGLNLQRGSLKFLDDLLQDFLAGSAKAAADPTLDVAGRLTLGTEWERAVAAIREMRDIATGEKVIAVVVEGNLRIIAVGGSIYENFEEAMREHGVIVEVGGVIGCSRLPEAPNLDLVLKRPDRNRGVTVLGLKSLESLREKLRVR